MNLYKSIILVMTLYLPCFCSAQNKFRELEAYFGLPLDGKEIEYYKYSSESVITNSCQSYEDCPTRTTIELLKSLLSAKNYSWDQRNYAYSIPKDKSYEDKELSDRFLPLRKIDFSIGQDKYEIVKFRLETTNDTTNHAMMFKFISSRWQVVSSDVVMSKLVIMFEYLSERALDAIFYNMNLGIPVFDNMVDEVYNGELLYLSKAINMRANKPYTPEEANIIFNSNSSSNKDSLIRVPCEFVFPIQDQKIRVYEDDSFVSAHEDTQIEEKLRMANLSFETAIPDFSYLFSYNDDHYEIVKIKHLESNEDEMLIFKNTKKQKLQIVSEIPSRLEPVMKVLRALSIDQIQNLNALSNSETPKEIQNISSQVKDEDNIINTVKLNTLID
ncbi:hypothetical protein LVD15_03655 [Fulvivirga maritima]|uniref:hypothetical protein n=1 Tax=Fulvivirga maritima TaxID=2904247 RepID=UPI001F208926|nr:hypothetical protein [Fulvivirga maritima]UII27539.1 hypothetical protein LVD15_03655 [Fulvivirga maritima]